ncbi:MAG TPA: YdcF family protein [Chitinophagaceae bacterium]|nr:YdcF family protein [Chitinophagaceae bacterium]
MFIVSKIIGFLLDPFIWILLLLLAIVFIRDNKWKKILRRTALLCFLFFSNNFIINNAWNSYQAKPVNLAPGAVYQSGIILGGLAGYDEELHQGFFSQASDRFIQAARLYHLGHIRKIIVTGGNALFVKESGYNEADFIAKNLQDLDIPAGDILLEKKSRNTIENALFSRQLMDSAGIHEKNLLITSAVHMPRALKVFTKQGISVEPFPCNYRILPADAEFTWKSLVPSVEAFGKWNILLKELLGTILI